MDAVGYLGIEWLMFLVKCLPSLPSEVIMPLTGFTVDQGTLSLAGVYEFGLVSVIHGPRHGP